MKGRTLLLAVLAALSVLCATAVAGDHPRPVVGTKGVDELSTAAGNDRVYARSGDDSVDGGAGHDRLRGGKGDDALFGGNGDDRVRGGQDDDFIDGGDGDDVLDGGGDGRDKDRIVCGEGYDVVTLGRNDVVLAEVNASGDGAAQDDGCEKVKRVGGGREACSATDDGCEPRPCASGGRGCEPVCPATVDECEPYEDPCLARLAPSCDPDGYVPDPDEPVEEPAPDEQ